MMMAGGVDLGALLETRILLGTDFGLDSVVGGFGVLVRLSYDLTSLYRRQNSCPVRDRASRWHPPRTSCIIMHASSRVYILMSKSTIPHTSTAS
jgi:hypothetical protein